MYNSEKNGAKIFYLGQNRNFLWIFKGAENRDSKTHYRAAEIAVKEWVECSWWRKTRTSIARSELLVLWLRSTLVKAETMPGRCVVFGCNNVRSKEKGILLHPTSFYGKSESEKQTGRRKWIDFVKSKRAHLEHTEHSAMCSERLHQPICWLFGSEAEERWNRRLCFSEQARSLCSSHQAAAKPETVKVSEANERWDISQHQSVCLSYFVHERLPRLPYFLANAITATRSLFE